MSKMSEHYAGMAAAAEMSEEYRAEIDHWKTRAERAEEMLGYAGHAMGQILMRATPHRDDTDHDRYRYLSHIESITRAFLAKLDKP